MGEPHVPLQFIRGRLLNKCHIYTRRLFKKDLPPPLTYAVVKLAACTSSWDLHCTLYFQSKKNMHRIALVAPPKVRDSIPTGLLALTSTMFVKWMRGGLAVPLAISQLLTYTHTHTPCDYNSVMHVYPTCSVVRGADVGLGNRAPGLSISTSSQC